jgi:type I restriction-modification system DNA methylase subunit
VLRGDYKQSEDGKVILPFTVLRHMDCDPGKVLGHLVQKAGFGEVNLIFIEDDDVLAKPGVVRTIYDPAAGTCGMLSGAGEDQGCQPWP